MAKVGICMVKVALRRSYYNYTSMFSFFVRYYLHKFVVTDQNTFVRGSQHLKIARVTTIVCCQQDTRCTKLVTHTPTAMRCVNFLTHWENFKQSSAPKLFNLLALYLFNNVINKSQSFVDSCQT